MRSSLFGSTLCSFFLLLCSLRGRHLAEGLLAQSALRASERSEPRSQGIKAASISSVPAVSAPEKISHPYTVSLRRRSDATYICAGVLVSKRHVLTGAHCVDPSRTSTDSKPDIVLGSTSSTRTSGLGVQVIATSNTFIHPSYISRGAPDLAILELVSEAEQTPIRLPPRFLPRQGKRLELIGWGRQSSSSGNVEVVQIASMMYVPRIICARRTARRRIGNHQICMGGDNNSCEGDNGGPIIYPKKNRRKDILVGIVGSSHVCGKSTTPDVHTNIWPYRKWIKSTAGLS